MSWVDNYTKEELEALEQSQGISISPNGSVSIVGGGSGGGGSGYDSSDGGGGSYTSKTPDMGRRTDLAGMTVSSNGMNVSYDKDGYAVTAVNPGHDIFKGTDRSVLAPSIDSVGRTGYSQDDLDARVMSNRELANRDLVRAQIANGTLSSAEGNSYIEAIRKLYGYTGGASGNDYAKNELAIFDPDAKDPTAGPLTRDWEVWRQTSVAGNGNTGPVSSLNGGNEPLAQATFRGVDYPGAKNPANTSAYGTYTTERNLYPGAKNPAEDDNQLVQSRYVDMSIGGKPAWQVLAELGIDTSKFLGAKEGEGLTPYERSLWGRTDRTTAPPSNIDISSPAINSSWKDLADQLARNYINMNYEDWTQGDAYKALADRYNANGQAAMQNTLGQVASRTGGLASSYATTAAQQQYNQYMSLLEQAARQGYDAERNQLYDSAKLASDYYGRDYNEYLNALEQMYKEREWQNMLDRQRISDQRYEDETGWDRWKYLDDTAYNRWKYGDQTAYDRDRDADKTAYNRWVDEYNRRLAEEEAARKAAEEAEKAKAYTPTFKWTEIRTELDKGRQLTGNMLRDYNYYVYGDPDYGMNVTPQGNTPSGNGGGTPSNGGGTPSGGSNVNNGGMDKQQVMDAQAAWNKLHPDKAIAVDGSWGPDSQKKTGIDNARDAYYELVAGNSNNPNGYVPAGVLNSETNGSGTSTGGNTNGSNYVDIKGVLMDMVNDGATWEDVRKALTEANQKGLLTGTEFQQIYNLLRNRMT